MTEVKKHGNKIVDKPGEFRDHTKFQTSKIIYKNVPDYILEFEALKSQVVDPKNKPKTLSDDLHQFAINHTENITDEQA